ncbi:MAG: beta galactosidase jelly roll domain-containing protein, partial [Victivallales bacterium]|nr:beta galactosidase jelly roll domain-containing protein [Victivallales bacterium]
EFRKYQAGGDIAPFVKAVENLDKFRASVESLNGMNIGYLQYLESRHWPARDILRLHSRNATQLDGWRIRFDPSEIGLKDNWQASETEWRDAAQIGTDSHWEKQPYGMKWKEENGCDYKGVGWYRVEFDLKNPALPHELVFGAVDGTATMYLNGRQIHFRPYPFNGDPNSWRASFTVPIPEQLLREKGNFLVVRVDKRIGLCGIWKPVFVVPSDKKGK